MRTTLRLLTFLLWVGVALRSHSQPLTVTTLAGSPPEGSADGTGSTARFASPWGVAVDNSGNLYVADTDNHTIRKITPGGIVTTLAGMAGVSGSKDDTGTNALFFRPQGIAVDDAGNVYVADTGNNTIRKITPDGSVSTLAGTAGTSGTNNATGGGARFFEPEGIAVNGDGSLLYVADTWNHTIRQITSGGAVSTLAGSPGTNGATDGTGGGAFFYQPQGVALDNAGNIYVGDTGNQTIRKVTPAGMVTTLAGSPGIYGSTNATGTNANFWAPQGLACDSAANVYVADSLNNVIRQITPAGIVTTLAGTAGTIGSADGTNNTSFWLPQSVAADTNGNLYVADSANGTIRQIAPGAVVTTVAGSASTGAANGPGMGARFNGPAGAAIDSAGNIYVADSENGTIRMVTSSGAVSTLAGAAGIFGNSDGPGFSARFYGPQAAAVDLSGNIYVADTANHTIRKITSGVVSTLAGSPGVSGVDDGTGSGARFNFPQALSVDLSGNLYVADTWNHTLRKVTPSGVVTTIAGVPGSYGDIDGTSAGDGTNTARFYCPSGLTVDAAGNIYVADTRNHIIRKVSSTGTVSTLAGLGGVWGNADLTNSDARFNLPQGMAVDYSGNLYVMDSGNHTIRMLTPVGTNWAVSTVAGTSGFNGSADGAGSAAQLFYPRGIGINNTGSFCFADWGNNTIRVSTSPLNVAPVIWVQPQDQTTAQGQTASFTVTAAGTAPLQFQWWFNNAPTPGPNAATYILPNVQPTDAGPYSVIITNNWGSVTSSLATLSVILAGQFDSITQLVDGSIQLSMLGTPYTNYVLQFSSNLVNWADLLTLSGPNGVFQYNDPSASTNSEGFYRLHLVP
jgi:sugar lactone lactonase YvrE